MVEEAKSERPMVDTVLIVDDEHALRVVLQKMLHDEGCHVIPASDGTEAQSILKANYDAVSAVVLDWVMPQMSGIDLLRWMKAQPQISHIPVILLTALDDPERIKEGIDAGAFYYLIKPFRRPLLQSILRAAVNDYHNTRHLLERLRQCEQPLMFLEEGTFCYRTIEEAEKLAVMIASATPDPEHAMLISELLTNAVEHGNLGISYEDKGKLLEANTWQAEVTRRLALPDNARKQVLVHIKRTDHAFRVEIQDQGPGFDYERYLSIDESRLFDNHGRGIVMAKSALNMEFEGPGNKVVVSIPLA